MARHSFRASGAGYFAALIGVGAVTALCVPFRDGLSATAVTLAYLLTVLLVATLRGTGPGLAATALAAGCLDFFFLPPINHLDVPNREEWLVENRYGRFWLHVGQLRPLEAEPQPDDDAA